jgi:thioredoxin 1
LAEELRGKLTVLKLNTEDNPEVVHRYGINAIPTFLVLRNGEVVKQVIGQMTYDKLKKQVEEALG